MLYNKVVQKKHISDGETTSLTRISKFCLIQNLAIIDKSRSTKFVKKNSIKMLLKSRKIVVRSFPVEK